MKTRLVVIAAVIGATMLPITSHALGLARQLSHMIGYTIVGVGSVDKVAEGNMGEKVIKLQDGRVFMVNMLLLDPLPTSDVIIFARMPSQDEINRYGGSLPKGSLTLYKLMVDEEIHDATLITQ